MTLFVICAVVVAIGILAGAVLGAPSLPATSEAVVSPDGAPVPADVT